MLFYFVETFTYVTSILFVWSIYASINILRLMYSVHKINRPIRQSDIIFFIVISSVMLLLFGTLFVWTLFTTKFMFSLFICETWYICFAIFHTITNIQPCLQKHHFLSK